MIDHLIETSAFLAPGTEDGIPPANWTSGAFAILPVQVWRETETVETEGGPVTRPVYLLGRWLLVRAPALDPELQAMPGYRWAWSDDEDAFVDEVADGDLELSGWWA